VIKLFLSLLKDHVQFFKPTPDEEKSAG